MKTWVKNIQYINTNYNSTMKVKDIHLLIREFASIVYFQNDVSSKKVISTNKFVQIPFIPLAKHIPQELSFRPEFSCRDWRAAF